MHKRLKLWFSTLYFDALLWLERLGEPKQSHTKTTEGKAHQIDRHINGRSRVRNAMRIHRGTSTNKHRGYG